MKKLLAFIILCSVGCAKDVVVKKTTTMQVKRSAPHSITVVSDGEIVFTQKGPMPLKIEGVECK